MLKNVADITSQGNQDGLNTQDNILAIQKSQSPDMMNVRVHFDKSLEKRLGSNTQNSVIIASSAGPGFSPSATLTANLQSYWRMDEASGTRYDSYGNNNLTDVNGVPSDGGIKNKASSFVASNTSYLIINNNSSMTTGDIDFSISSWIYLTSTSQSVQRSIISKKDLGSSANAVTLLHMDGSDGSTTFTDSELVPKTYTANGNAQISTAQSKFGGASALFDGSGDYISTPNSTDFDFGTGDFTCDFWVRFASIQNCYFFARGASPSFGLRYSSGTLDLFIAGATPASTSWSPVTGTWYHIAISRNSTSLKLFIDGTEVASATNSSSITDSAQFNIGSFGVSNDFNGYIDEFRVLKGTGAFTSNFSVPTVPYGNPTNPSQVEYFLYVNTDNILTFEVSSSGTVQNGQVRATSFGALGTATWYNAIAYHDASNDFLGIGVNLSLNSSSYASGVRAGSAPLTIGAVSNGASNFFDGRIDETGFWKKVLTLSDMTALYNAGSANTYQTAFDTKPWASFDFGASSIRWLMVSAGTGVYASSNLGVTWVNVATDRTANYQYFERSKNVLIATSDSYDTPLAWPGSANTFMVSVNSNAPLCKYSINFQGFLILLNSNLRKRGFFYQDENTQLTGTWASSFDIPSTQDDEITATFILRRYLYVSTRYYLYRVSYVGGNPDFSYLKVKDWGYVSRTVKYLYVEGIGQIVAGLCWDGKLRFFDGSDDQIFSAPIEQDNNMCEFALNNLSFVGSGPIISFAETDYNENVYKLIVAIGAQSMQTTHMINYDGRSKSFYPYNRQFYNTMVMAESGNRRFLMAFDRSGYCHMMDSGNLDGNTQPIDDHYDGAFIYDKSPAQFHKGHEMHLFFNNESCGRVYLLDRVDFDNEYALRNSFTINGNENKHHIHKQIDVTDSYNNYQWRITSSMGTANPWKLQRYDMFLKGMGIGKNAQE